jgi:hypothetical protein
MPTERHPACRQREARSGFGTERENLTGDAKGKGASGSIHHHPDLFDAPAGKLHDVVKTSRFRSAQEF